MNENKTIIEILRDITNFLDNDENRLKGYLNRVIQQKEIDMIFNLTEDLERKGFLLKNIDEVPNNLFDTVMSAKSIINSGYARLNYAFAYYFRKLNVSGFLNAVIKSKNAKYNYKCAMDVDMADIEAHENMILASKDAKYNYMFAKNFEEANINKHKVVVDASGNEKYMAKINELIVSPKYLSRVRKNK